MTLCLLADFSMASFEFPNLSRFPRKSKKTVSNRIRDTGM